MSSCFLKEFEKCLLIIHIRYIRGGLLIKRRKKKTPLPPWKKNTLTLLFLWIILIQLITKWCEWFFNYFLWSSSCLCVGKSFMICISRIYKAREKPHKKQFTTAIQKELLLISRLHLTIIWSKCKVKESNCISPDSPNAVLHCNEWFLSFLENLGPNSFITNSKIFWDLGFKSKSCRSKLTFSDCHCLVKPYHFVFNILNYWC